MALPKEYEQPANSGEARLDEIIRCLQAQTAAILDLQESLTSLFYKSKSEAVQAEVLKETEELREKAPTKRKRI